MLFVYMAKSLPKYVISRREAWKEKALESESMDLEKWKLDLKKEISKL